MKTKGLVLSTGFALFSMFFGSGNLVFPIAVGQSCGGSILFASIGILLTGVLVPFLGVLGILLYKGDLKSFFSCFGKKGLFLFTFLSLAIMGPFGVLARCLTVAHGALELIMPGTPLAVSSGILCCLVFLLTINKNKIVNLLGTFLTPLLLLFIGIIAFYSLKGGSPFDVNVNFLKAFKNGFFQGYQTMDLLAAFFFSTFVIKHLFDNTKNLEGEKTTLKVFFKASFVGGALLSSVYVALVAMGWNYSSLLANKLPQEMLGAIALESLGPYAAPLVCLAVIFACLTTAIVLASLFSDFLRVEVAKEKINAPISLAITLLISFLVSNLEFSGIAKFIGPILEVTYPALIVLTLVNIFNKFYGYKTNHWPFTATLAAKLCLL